MRRKRILPIGLLLILVPGSTLDAAQTPVRRFIDELKRLGPSFIIDDVHRRTLPAYRSAFAFPLHDVPPHPALRFSIGLRPEPEESGAVRFEVVLRRPAGEPVILYAKELSEPGWHDERVDLSGRELEGAQISFVKTATPGTRQVLSQGLWGEPMLLSAVPPRRPSIVLVSIDTLRADHVGAYGYEKAGTPTLDALAHGGVWYANAYSASTWTYPSHAALLRGAFPTQLPPLEKEDNGGLTLKQLCEAMPTSIAQVLAEAGYRTAAFTGGGYVSPKWLFALGFDSYYAFEKTRPPEGCPPDRFDGPEVFRRAGAWLRDNGHFPFFLFVHTYDAHDRCEVWPKGLAATGVWPDPGPEGRSRVVSEYDRAIAKADSLVAGLLGDLDAAGMANETIVVVTSDHGEEFWEHGAFGHGCTLKPYEPLIHVPLILRVPGDPKRSGRVETPVGAADVAPTLLALLGEKAPDSMRGSLLPGLGLDGRSESSPVYVHCGDNLAVRVGRNKLITSRRGASPDEVYDLRSDPSEKNNLLGEDPALDRRLLDLVQAYWKTGSGETSKPEKAQPSLDESTKERLRALGYLQ